MQLDFEIQRSTRRCAATERELQPGEVCFSVLETRGTEVIRKDYCRAAWAGPPEGVFGWWKSRVPEPTARKIKLAPNDVLLELFDQLAEQPDGADMRYVLALLLVRRRVMRFETADAPLPEPSSVHGVEMLTLFCPQRGTTYEILAAAPSEERIDHIQQQLNELLIADAT